MLYTHTNKRNKELSILLAMGVDVNRAIEMVDLDDFVAEYVQSEDRVIWIARFPDEENVHYIMVMNHYTKTMRSPKLIADLAMGKHPTLDAKECERVLEVIKETINDERCGWADEFNEYFNLCGWEEYFESTKEFNLNNELIGID